MENPPVWLYQFSDTFPGLSGDSTGPAALFMLGAAAGVLILSSLTRLNRLGRAGGKSGPPWEYRCRIAAAVSILCFALGMGLPFIPGFKECAVPAGSMVQLLGFLGFELFLALLLLRRCFPHWGWKQFLPLPVVTALIFLLPLFKPGALPLALGCFSLALCGLCLPALVLCIRKKQFQVLFPAGIGLFLVLGLSFVPLSGRNAFFRPAALLAYLLLEHRIFSGISEAPPKGALKAASRSLTGESSEELVEELQELWEEEASPETAASIVQSHASAESSPGTDSSVASFIPQEFLAILNKKKVTDLKLGDHIKQEMTIFFSDIRQFTELSEDLTPEESFAFINSYLSRIVPEITKYGGFVDKYIGDAILALFPRADGADSAVRAAVAIHEKIQEYNSHRAKCGYRSLSMGIGLHTGILMMGVVGTEDRMQNTVISDAVNLASRVESLTKAFRVSLAISEETFKKLQDPGAYQYRFVGKVRVKGKSAPVSIFEIFDGIDKNLQKKKVEANRFFEQGMFFYYQKKYSEALLEFRKVLEFLPDDGASAFYIDNCMTKLT